MDMSINNTKCSFCGQCTVVCPVGALKETDHIARVWDAILGHSTITMTQRYAHLAPDTVRAAAISVQGILGQHPGKVITFRKQA